MVKSMRSDTDILNLLQDTFWNDTSISDKLSEYDMWELANNPDEEIRSYLAKALVNEESQCVAVNMLRYLSQDKDELVRIEAVNSLAFLYRPKVFQYCVIHLKMKMSWFGNMQHLVLRW